MMDPRAASKEDGSYEIAPGIFARVSAIDASADPINSTPGLPKAAVNSSFGAPLVGPA